MGQRLSAASCVLSHPFFSLVCRWSSIGSIVHLPLRIFTIRSNPCQSLRGSVNLTKSSRGSRDRALTFPGWSDSWSKTKRNKKKEPKPRTPYFYKLKHCFCSQKYEIPMVLQQLWSKNNVLAYKNKGFDVFMVFSLFLFPGPKSLVESLSIP